MAYRNTKRDTVKALLQNENMGKIIRDALSTPLGSTPRKRAKKIVSIMKKLKRDDGVGGPGYVTAGPQPLPPKVSKRKLRRGVRVYASAPKMGVRKTVHDGAGGPGDLSTLSLPTGYSGAFSGISASSLLPKPTGGIIQSGSGTSSGINMMNTSAPNFTFSSINPYYSGANELGKLSTGTASSTPIFSGMKITPTAPTTRTSGVVSGLSGGQSGGLGIQSGGINTTPSRGLQTPNLSTLGGYEGMLSSIKNAKPGTTGTPGSGAIQGSAADANAALLEAKGGTLPSGFSGGSWADQFAEEATNSANDSLTDLVNGFYSPTAFANWAMQSVKNLRQIPGFEDVPDGALPHGASLSGQLNALYDNVRMESGVDQAMAQLESSNELYSDYLTGGVGLQDRLNNYITRRDEYLNHTTNMLNDFTKKAHDGSIDMYDPHVAKMAQDYVTYLGTLRSRQNKRYVEWVNTSVNAYGDQLEAASNMVSSNLNIYDRKFNDMTARYERQEKITIDEYNELKDMLKEVYNTVTGLPDKEIARQRAEAEVNEINARAAKDLLDVNGDASTMNSAITETTKVFKDLLWSKDDNANTPLGRNLPAMLDMVRDNAGQITALPLLATMQTYRNNIYKDFTVGKTADDYIAAAQEHLQNITQFRYDMDSSTAGGMSAEDSEALGDYSTDIEELTDTVTNQLIDRVSEDIKGDDRKSNGLKKAVEDLLDRTTWYGGKRTISRQEFITKYKAFGLPESLLGGLYYMFYEDPDMSELSKEELQSVWVDDSKYEYSDDEYYSPDDVSTDSLVDQVTYNALKSWGNLF